jgi:hypothetical protein
VAAVGGALVLGACGGGDGDVTVTPQGPDETTGTTAERGGDEGGGEATSAARLFSASEETAAVDSGRMLLTMQLSGNIAGTALDTEILAEGEFDNVAERSEVTIDMGRYMSDLMAAAGAGGGAGAGTPGMPDMSGLTMTQITDGTTLYMRFDGAQFPGFPAGWVSMDVAQMAEEMGMSASQLGGPVGGLSGPGGFLAALEESGATVDVVEEDELDGDDVTRYEGSIDPETSVRGADPEQRQQLEQLFAQSGMAEPIPFVAWVDEDGVVRQMEMTMTADVEGTVLEMDVRLELFDLDEPVDIQVPPPAEVTPFSEAFGSMMSGAGTGAAA